MWKHGFSTTGKQGKAGGTMIEESIAAVKQAEQQAESMAADARKDTCWPSISIVFVMLMMD
jgi:hypothetical protein